MKLIIIIIDSYPAYTPNSSDYLDPATPTRRRKEWRRERIEEDNARAAEAAAVAAEEAAAEEEARFERRNLQPEYAIADMRSQLLWLIYAAFMSITTAVIIFLLLGYLTINPMLWSIPDPARLAEYDKLYADAWKHTSVDVIVIIVITIMIIVLLFVSMFYLNVYLCRKYMETFEQFEIYLLNQPTMSQDICFDMTSVICEPFLLAMPNMSYQDFLRNLSVYFPSSNVKSPNSTDIWNWDAARTPYDLVIFAHIFSFNELKIFSTCVTFIQRERQKLLRKMRPGDRMNLYSRIRLNREWAKYMVIGICK